MLVAQGAQAQSNYPYSHFGLGDVLDNQNIFHLGMGGACLADNSPYIVNYNNPASYSQLGLSALQLAVRGNNSNLTNGADINARTGDLQISYLNLGMPLGHKMGLSFGLMPTHKIYYALANTYKVFDTTILYNISSGDGGFQDIYIGFGKAIKNFSFGTNIAYTFGKKNITTLNRFADSLKILTSQYDNFLRASGLSFNLGVQYNKQLKNNRNIKIGATFSPAFKLNATREISQRSLWENYNAATTTFNVYDTAMYQERSSGKIIVPSKFGLGINSALNQKVIVAADFNASNWKNYRLEDTADSLGSSYRIALGLNYIPDVNNTINYWKHVEYRVGLYNGKEYVRLKNTSMPVNAFTAGLSLPLRRTRDALGFLHASFTAGIRGTTKYSLTQDRFVRFNLALTLNAKWFTPRKYD